MSAQESALARGEILRSGEMFEPGAARGAAVRVRIITADPATLLELYREDRGALHEAVKRQARVARSEIFCGFFARLFC